MSVLLLRYISKCVFFKVGGALILLTVVYAAIDLVEATSRLNVDSLTIFAVYPFKILQIVSHVLPLAVTVGILLHLGAMKKSGEWESLMSSGIGPFSILRRLMVMPTVYTLLALLLVHLVSPLFISKYEAAIGQQTFEESQLYTFENYIGRHSPWGKDNMLLLFERDDSGQAVSVRAVNISDNSVVAEWRRETGWSGGLPAQVQDMPIPRNQSVNTLCIGANGLLGASQTTLQLRSTVQSLRRQGQRAPRVEAEIALRTALSGATMLLPFIGLLLAITRNVDHGYMMVLLALGISAAYWALLVALWNGAGMGIWPSWVVSIGVCGLFALIGVGLAVKLAIQLRLR